MGCSLPGSSVHGISQQEYWSGLPFPPPGDFLDPGMEPTSPALSGKFFFFLITEPPLCVLLASLVALTVKNLLTIQETRVQSLG